MRTIALTTIQQQVSARKAALGMIDAAAEIEAMRNKGERRTRQKRELLRRAEQRAQAAGLLPAAAYF